jgi:hypothetical protein
VGKQGPAAFTRGRPFLSVWHSGKELVDLLRSPPKPDEEYLALIDKL